MMFNILVKKSVDFYLRCGTPQDISQISDSP